MSTIISQKNLALHGVEKLMKIPVTTKEFVRKVFAQWALPVHQVRSRERDLES